MAAVSNHVTYFSLEVIWTVGDITLFSSQKLYLPWINDITAFGIGLQVYRNVRANITLSYKTMS